MAPCGGADFPLEEEETETLGDRGTDHRARALPNTYTDRSRAVGQSDHERRKGALRAGDWTLVGRSRDIGEVFSDLSFLGGCGGRPFERARRLIAFLTRSLNAAPVSALIASTSHEVPGLQLVIPRPGCGTIVDKRIKSQVT